jgi:hypothetical protein
MLLGEVRAVNRFGARLRPEGLARRIVEYFLIGADTRCRLSFNGLGQQRGHQS